MSLTYYWTRKPSIIKPILVVLTAAADVVQMKMWLSVSFTEETYINCSAFYNMKHGFKSLIITSTTGFLLWLSNIRRCLLPVTHLPAITLLPTEPASPYVCHLPSLCTARRTVRQNILFTHQHNKVAFMPLGGARTFYGIFVPTIFYFLVQPFHLISKIWSNPDN